MRHSLSLAVRTFLAIGLMVGFYILALAVSASLLYFPYAEFVYFNRIDPRLAIAAVAAAGAILWSIVPRPDRFPQPRPELTEDEQPELLKLIAAVALATGQRKPRHIYLLIDVNAWVAQRGGLMGFRSQRVMGIGLPLLETLTIDQLKAVIAHEFGHYHGGDTMLGPWIYKTRAGIERTITKLEESWIAILFVGYGKLFLRITNTVSRAQEFAADALAARIVNPVSLIEGLKRVHRAGVAFQPFWSVEYAPALSYGVRPPLGAGFARFLENQGVAKQTDDFLAKELIQNKSNPYDTHPSLPERINALSQPANAGTLGDDRPAITLLNYLPRLEGELLSIAVASQLSTAEPVDWNDVPSRVWLPKWGEFVATQRRALDGVTAGTLPMRIQHIGDIARELRYDPGYLPDSDQRRAHAYALLSRALAVALSKSGWILQGNMNEPVTVRLGDESIDIYAIVAQLSDGSLPADHWQQRCNRLGIADLALA
jgi:heat shock protein HtpX